MWKDKNEIPSKDGDYPAVIHPTFKRNNIYMENFRETLRYYNGSWCTMNFYSLNVYQWELISWFDVPEYQ